MQRVISALHFVWHDIHECLARSRDEFGLDGVELSLNSSFQRPHCTREDLSELRRTPLPETMHLSAHIWENLALLDIDAGESALLNWLSVCEEQGLSDLVIHGGSHEDRREGIRRTRQVLQRVLPRFEAAGVVLNLENHYAFSYRDCHELFSEPWEFREILSLDSPSLKVCYDTGHANMTGNDRELLTELAPWLNYVHLADNHGIHDDHCMFREGTVNWDLVFDSLRSSGFAGTICVEFPVRDNPVPFRECMREIDAIWRPV